MQEYSEAFRARMVERMSGPNPISANALSKELGLNQSTLSKWLRQAATVNDVAKRRSPKAPGNEAERRPQDRTAQDKVRIVLEAAALSEQERGAFLRREGLHDDDLARFREEVSAAAVAGLAPSKPDRREVLEAQKRIKQLEREIQRKDKALAETAALLVLRKKLDALLGDEGDDT